MDSTKAITFFISFAFTAHAVSAGCLENAQQDPEYTKCFTEFVKLVQPGSGTGQGNPMAALCSDIGKKTFTCVMRFMQSCPELGNAMGAASFKDFSQPGQLETMCNMITAQSDPSCMLLQACLSNITSEDIQHGNDELGGAKPLNEYRYIQKNLQQMCGHIKHFECIENDAMRCPTLVNQLKSMIKVERNWDEYKKFVKEDCPKVPAEFFTNSCVKTNLHHKKFADCFHNTTTNDKCRTHEARIKCVRDAIESCGKEHFQTFVKTTPMMITDFPRDCTQIGGSSTMSVPVTSYAFGLILLFLRYFIDF